jgi:hypothetical protein
MPIPEANGTRVEDFEHEHVLRAAAENAALKNAATPTVRAVAVC